MVVSEIHLPLLISCSRCKTDRERDVLQTLMYACQRMENDKQLHEYHVPPVSLPPPDTRVTLSCSDTVPYTAGSTSFHSFCRLDICCFSLKRSLDLSLTTVVLMFAELPLHAC